MPNNFINKEDKMKKVFFMLFSFIVCMGVVSLSEAQINTSTTYDQVKPKIFRSNTSYLVVWEQSAQNGPSISSYIMCRTYDLSGNPLTDVLNLSSGTFYSEGSAYNPKVCSNGTNFLVVWANASKRIKGRFLTALGAINGSEFEIESPSGFMGYPDEIAIASDGTNYFVIYNVAYHAKTIYGRIVSGDGSAVGSKISITTTDFAQDISISSNRFPYYASYNTYLIAWSRYPYNGGTYKVYGRLYNTSGIPLTNETLISTSYPTKDQKDVAIGTNGYDYLVVWTTPTDTDTWAGVRGRRIFSIVPNGTSLYFNGNEFQISTNDGSQIELNPEVAGGKEFYYLVTWQVDDENGLGVFGQFLTWSGSFVGGEFRLNADLFRDQQCPALTACSFNYGQPPLSDYNFFVVWQSNTYDLGYTHPSKIGYDIYGGFFSISDRIPKNNPK